MDATTASPVQINIQDSVGVSLARRAARRMAGQLNFNEVQQEEIVLCVSELGNNLWQHATRGTIYLEATFLPKAGIKICAVDNGPGIKDLDRALRDGTSSRGGMGSGLAAVHRLMDQLQIHSRPGEGTKVEAIKWRS